MGVSWPSPRVDQYPAMACLHSGQRFEPFAKGSVRFRFGPIQPNLFQKVQPRTGPGPDSRYPMHQKCGRCNLPPAGGKLHRHFHSSVPDGQYPMHRKMREVQLAAGGRQVAPTFPLIDAQQVRRSKKVRFRCRRSPGPL